MRPHDEEYCYLTTTGRRTGRAHRIEIWFGQHASTFYLLSGGGGRADWVRNIRSDPAVRFEVGGQVMDATARVVTDPAEDALARRLLAAKYQGWQEGADMSGWARTALPVAIDVTG
jgi:deazaflavin-dependent oxidoreductase (nitroreductase family)